jgi:hypothetical protein
VINASRCRQQIGGLPRLVALSFELGSAPGLPAGKLALVLAPAPHFPGAGAFPSRILSLRCELPWQAPRMGEFANQLQINTNVVPKVKAKDEG